MGRQQGQLLRPPGCRAPPRPFLRALQASTEAGWAAAAVAPLVAGPPLLILPLLQPPLQRLPPDPLPARPLPVRGRAALLPSVYEICTLLLPSPPIADPSPRSSVRLDGSAGAPAPPPMGRPPAALLAGIAGFKKEALAHVPAEGAAAGAGAGGPSGRPPASLLAGIAGFNRGGMAHVGGPSAPATAAAARPRPPPPPAPGMSLMEQMRAVLATKRVLHSHAAAAEAAGEDGDDSSSSGSGSDWDT